MKCSPLTGEVVGPSLELPEIECLPGVCGITSLHEPGQAGAFPFLLLPELLEADRGLIEGAVKASCDLPSGDLNRGNGREGQSHVLGIENLQTPIPFRTIRSRPVPPTRWW